MKAAIILLFAVLPASCGGSAGGANTTDPVDSGVPEPAHLSFLSTQEASAAIVSEITEPFFSLLQPMEMAALLGQVPSGHTLEEKRDEVRNRFAGAVLDFSEEEKNAITWYVDKLDGFLFENTYRIAALPWSFIKSQSSLAGGMAFTREGHVVLSEDHVSQLVAARTSDENAAYVKWGTLLLHEKVHVLQRQEPLTFDTLYEDLWGLVHAGDITTVPWLEQRQVTNPDAVRLEWVVPLETNTGQERIIWARTVFGVDPTADVVPSMPEDFIGVTVELEKLNDGSYRVLTNKEGTPIMTDLEGDPAYTALFPDGLAWDHPHEISAYALSEAIMRAHGYEANESSIPPLDDQTSQFLEQIFTWATATWSN